ncbi:uncharacterized protein SETTUDRAFT_117011 [Exserohilum turcica Et28A]|uniref:MOSC domain-containing protein n=1 Tax=Exserohilum turcicum (strain 28A) TaxID=671987 RepID=R0IHV3_EXST2|nr:uncharacterized protein SETTUDRAFT_117011 [Exserohilum turcica Et28A]EOA84765.1 hypothetical protein SETTUDRAFT_117011 [Exserohilum turcica Et28A]
MQGEYKASIANVPPIWLLATAACIVPVALVCYSQGLLSSKPGNAAVVKEKDVPELEIAEIYVYPIKSVRSIKSMSAIATSHGFAHDRSFMLLIKTPSGYKNMAVAECPQMTQFVQEISSAEKSSDSAQSSGNKNKDNAVITVHYLACGDTSRQSSIAIPLEPDTADLKTVSVNMHGSATPAFLMPQRYSDWFTFCLGFDVDLVYLGPNRRSPLFSEMSNSSSSSKLLPKLWNRTSTTTSTSLGQNKLTFADCAPYLFCTAASLADVSRRLRDPNTPEKPMDITKFRPNVVLKSSSHSHAQDEDHQDQPWQEDYWGTIQVNGKTNVVFVHNCVRCKSINIDFETGKPGQGPHGEVLKRMQRDRRIDTGARWSPVFGRYAFWDAAHGDEEEVLWSVGDKVRVTRVNGERSVWSWPGLG